jgi:hypothetical protein
VVPQPGQTDKCCDGFTVIAIRSEVIETAVTVHPASGGTTSCGYMDDVLFRVLRYLLMSSTNNCTKVAQAQFAPASTNPIVHLPKFLHGIVYGVAYRDHRVESGVQEYLMDFLCQFCEYQHALFFGHDPVHRN